MSGARMSALATLRGQIERIETAGAVHLHERVALGHGEIDGVLKGGLARAAIHEVFCEGRQGTAATGFVMGLAGRISAQRPLLWVRQDFSELETGALSMSGLAELGLDPRRVVMVRAADVESALRTSADALACDALGAVVLELWGDVRQFDLVASRKLTLAAQGSGVTGLMLRMAAQPLPSTAETRWILRAAHSPPGSVWSAWGTPRFDAELLRNRHGLCGRWIMEWNCDECQFSEPSTYSQPVAATPADRPDPAVLWERRTA
ncbi:DNA repair protein [Bradyrhizobium nitroreducens]|uniref:DNA repair protein n=1 Tax=Bradyrhizobium nitroreducens TaxID=709803 RepID=A0A2M6UKJ8_9BRAD|nr:DNA repair protein [Bradyrhizobium nitroreducens]PIT05140.1 DNA repair protein [Bradyrhizobium nitroreducens]